MISYSIYVLFAQSMSKFSSWVIYNSLCKHIHVIIRPSRLCNDISTSLWVVVYLLLRIPNVNPTFIWVLNFIRFKYILCKYMASFSSLKVEDNYIGSIGYTTPLFNLYGSDVHVIGLFPKSAL